MMATGHRLLPAAFPAGLPTAIAAQACMYSVVLLQLGLFDAELSTAAHLICVTDADDRHRGTLVSALVCCEAHTPVHARNVCTYLCHRCAYGGSETLSICVHQTLAAAQVLMLQYGKCQQCCLHALCQHLAL